MPFRPGKALDEVQIALEDVHGLSAGEAEELVDIHEYDLLEQMYEGQSPQEAAEDLMEQWSSP